MKRGKSSKGGGIWITMGWEESLATKLASILDHTYGYPYLKWLFASSDLNMKSSAYFLECKLNCPLRSVLRKKSSSIFLLSSHCRNIMNEDLYDLVELNDALLISRSFEHPQMPLRKRRSIDATFGDYRTAAEDRYSFSTYGSHEIKSNNTAICGAS